ncbi:uncharacterized protein wu:fl23c11 [Triplophysa dalaica]|uniref:uncharacterized protein wu:fl23c11 n=1 Tax=Triplophysa dalaica TaxID=1582913 RepID=UPI0024DFC2DD|nr:uncharacterized protein wu:fl23c11 [Triplophysa dalaica]
MIRTLVLFSLPLYIFTEVLERVSLSEEHALTCGQGIIDCEVKPGACLGHDENVFVCGLKAYVVLCQTKEKTWSLCLKLLVNITVRDAVGVELAGDVSGDDKAADVLEKAHRRVLYEDEDNTTATVCVCYTNPSLSKSKILHFTLSSSVFDGGNTLQVWMSLVVKIREVDLGSPLTVYSFYTNSTKQVTILTPSKEEVCSMDGDVVFCKDAPRLGRRTDPITGAIILYVENADKERFQKFQTCQKLERDGKCLKVEWNDASQEFEIPRSSVAPCLCFEIWGNFPRKVHCPFLNETVVSDSNVSVSVSAIKLHNSVESDRTALIWNLTSPCRLETELWLCRKGSSVDSSCNQINDMHHAHKYQKRIRRKDKWIRTDAGHWQLQGEFSQVEHSSSLCVQVKVRGIAGYLGPVCPFEVKRARWSFLLLVCVLLVCLSVLGAHAFQGALKSWISRWLKVDNMTRAAGGVEVLLVCPPDRDHEVTELICRLSSSLSTLGFNVSTDLSNRSEINSLGPIPWLHSHLDQVQICGGRAVLVLTQTTCERAKEWARRGVGEKYEPKEAFQSSPFLDVFNASLSCILADYLQGRAGKRFMLAQVKEQSPGSVLTFPEFFQGLPFFSLPSQSLGFLMELTHGVHKGRGMARHCKRSMSLSTAAQALSGAICGLTGSTGHKSETEDA